MTLTNDRRLNEVLRDGRALLADFDPDEPLGAIAAGRSEQLGYVAGVTAAGVDFDALLVRPDGIVAWAGDTTDRAGLALAFSRWLGDQLPVGTE